MALDARGVKGRGRFFGVRRLRSQGRTIGRGTVAEAGYNRPPIWRGRSFQDPGVGLLRVASTQFRVPVPGVHPWSAALWGPPRSFMLLSLWGRKPVKAYHEAHGAQFFRGRNRLALG